MSYLSYRGWAFYWYVNFNGVRRWGQPKRTKWNMFEHFRLTDG